MKKDRSAVSPYARFFACRLLASAVAMLMLAAPAAAQLSVSAPPFTPPISAMHGVDVANIPASGGYLSEAYLTVSGTGAGVVGVFVRADGTEITVPFVIPTTAGRPGFFPRAAYSLDLNGGNGGFLVAWASEDAPGVRTLRARVVSPSPFPTIPALLGPETVISGPAAAWTGAGSHALAYSSTSQRFFVAFTSTPGLDALGPTPAATGQVFGITLDLALNPVGSGLLPLSDGPAGYPSVAWNSTDDTFGVGLTGSSPSTAYSALVTVAGPASFVRRVFNELPRSSALMAATDLTFNPQHARYLMAWYQLDSGGPKAQVAEFTGAGSVTSYGTASFILGTPSALSLAYNPASGTILLAGPSRVDGSLLGAELNGSGYRFAPEVALSLQTGIEARFVRVGSASSLPHWWSAFALNGHTMAGQLVATATTGGGSSGTYGFGGSVGGCSSVYPGPAFTCLNGAWVYTGGTTDGPFGTGSIGTCLPIDGGTGLTCVDGRWVYAGGNGGELPGSGPTGCSTVSPGATWTCYNGGWLPPGMTPPGGPPSPPPPPPPASGCTTTQPGPDWSCVNGGWLPPGSGGGSPPSPVVPTSAVNADFNGDRKSDLVFKDAWGRLRLRQFSGTTLVGEQLLPGPYPGSAATVVGTGDFNGDGHPDVLWQTHHGAVYLNIMQGPTIVGQQAIEPTDTHWSVKGTADFNGDGFLDIIWTTTLNDPRVLVWFMRPVPGPSGFNVLGHAGPNNTPLTAYITDGTGLDLSSPGVFAGLGDFNDDGRVDMAWRNSSTGSMTVWYLNGTVRYFAGPIAGSPGPEWGLSVLGDVIGDTSLDAVFQRTDGALAFYTLNNFALGAC